MQPVSGARHPFSATVWDACELWSRDRLDAWHLDRLKAQLAHVAVRSPFYRQRFAEAGFEPADLRSPDDLRRLPLTTKRDYLDAIEAAPPFGTMLACDPADAVRVHFSSGTSSAPVPCFWSAADLARWTDLYARYFYAQGLRRHHVFQCMFNYAWFVGGLGATLAAQRIGALVVPGSSGDSRRQIETIFRFGTRCVAGTPSFMAHLAETAREIGRDLRDSQVGMVCTGGEAGASIPATRRQIEQAWGARMFDCYGALECQPIGWDTAAQDGPRLAEDFIFAEVLDPATHEAVADGAPGVLVITHLDKQASPLVRWWTGDVVVRDRHVGPDGRTHARLVGGVLGRADDMLVIRGVNVFPSALEEVIRAQPGGTGEYQIVIDDSLKDPATGFLTGVGIRVESTDPAYGARVAAAIRDRLAVRARVEVLDPGALPRAVHKAQRLIRS